MFTQLLNWRTALAAIAIAIVTGTVFYSNYLSKKIEQDERKKVNVWVESLKTKIATEDQATINFAISYGYLEIQGIAIVFTFLSIVYWLLKAPLIRTFSVK